MKLVKSISKADYLEALAEYKEAYRDMGCNAEMFCGIFVGHSKDRLAMREWAVSSTVFSTEVRRVARLKKQIRTHIALLQAK